MLRDINELSYTSAELEYFKTEMCKYQLPKYVKIWKKIGIPFIRITFLPALIIIIIFGILYMSEKNYGQWDWMWTLDKVIALTYIAGYGLWTLTSHIIERISTNKLRRRLKLTKQEFEILIEIFQISGMN